MANEITGDRMSESMNKLSDAQRALVDRTKEYAQVTDSYVRDNPWVAIAVGAGIGLLVGLLIARAD